MGKPFFNRLLLAILILAVITQSILLWKRSGTVQTVTPDKTAGTIVNKNRVVDLPTKPTETVRLQAGKKFQDRLIPGIEVNALPAQVPSQSEALPKNSKKQIYDRVPLTP
jgi:hypothetical protein